MLPPPTDALEYENKLADERVLFLLSALSEFSTDEIEIDGGPRLSVFETGMALSRASDLSRIQ